jgi:hypothetical protein
MILAVENALNTVVFFQPCNKSDIKLSHEMERDGVGTTHKKIEAEIDVGFGDGKLGKYRSHCCFHCATVVLGNAFWNSCLSVCGRCSCIFRLGLIPGEARGRCIALWPTCLKPALG